MKGLMRTVAAGGFAGGLAVIAAGILFVWRDYYVLDMEAQAAHPMHEVVGASGFIGLWLGVLGTGLMLAMLSYTLRKKLTGAKWMGPIRGWLIFHIICGIFGPILIILHGGMRIPTGLISMGFWFMIAVALSGVFGRYIYGFFPRTAKGVELDLDEAARNLASLKAQLVEQTADANAEQIGQAVLLARDIDLKVNSLVQLVRFEFETRRRSRLIRGMIATAGLPDDVRDAATDTLLAQLSMRKSQETWAMSKRVFRYWHLFHLPLAKVMYGIIVLHVVFSLLFSGALQTLTTVPF
jgi:hypothetical protein